MALQDGFFGGFPRNLFPAGVNVEQLSDMTYKMKTLPGITILKILMKRN